MQIDNLSISNFHGLDRVLMAAGPGLNVIAGPNAVGKTTVLESIRLVKVLLAPRYQGEAQQVLAAMGATNNGVVSLSAPFSMLAHDSSKPIEISIIITLNDTEIATIKASIEQLAIMMLQTELARSINENALDLAQYLSIVEGQSRLNVNRDIVSQAVIPLTTAHRFPLNVTLDVATGNVRGADSNSQAYISFLESVSKFMKAEPICGS